MLQINAGCIDIWVEVRPLDLVKGSCETPKCPRAIHNGRHLPILQIMNNAHTRSALLERAAKFTCKYPRDTAPLATSIARLKLEKSSLYGACVGAGSGLATQE